MDVLAWIEATFGVRIPAVPGTSSSPIWRSRRRRRQPGGGPTRPVPPPRAPHHLSASYDAAPRKGARPPGTGARPGAAVAGHRPPVRRGSRTGHRYDPARDRGPRATGRADAAEHTHAPGLAAGAGRNYSQGLRGPNEICCAVTRSSERRPSGASK